MSHNTPTGFLSVEDKTKLLKEIKDQPKTDPTINSLCQLCSDALEKRVTEIWPFLEETLEPELLFAKSCFDDGRIFHVVRHILDAVNVNTNRLRKNTRVAIKIADALFEDEETKQTAMDIINSELEYRKNPRSNGPMSDPVAVNRHQSNRGPEGSTLAKNRATVVSSFRNEDKFSGTITCSTPLHRVKQKYETLISEQEIPDEHSVNLLHSCLSGMALDFFYKSIQKKVTSVSAAFELLQKHFNSFQHQAQARMYLNGMSIDAVVREKSCSELVALETIHGRILDTAPSCGPDFQADSHRQEFLANAVKRCKWASPILQARLTPTSQSELYDYNTLYSKLSTALTANRSFGNEPPIQYGSDSTSPTFYGSQYAKPPSNSHRRGNAHDGHMRDGLNISSMLRPPNRIKRRMTASELQRLKDKTKCLRCNKVGHWRNECPEKHKKPLKKVMLSHIRNLGSDESAISKTLLAFAEEEEEYENYLEMTASFTEENPTEDSANSFEALVNGCENGDEYSDDNAQNDLLDVIESLDSAETFLNSVGIEGKSARLFPDIESSVFHANGKMKSHVPKTLCSLEFFGRDSPKTFNGALLDTGAQRSVIGLQQAKLYCEEAGIEFKPSPSPHRFSFGAGRAKSLGRITIIVPTPGSVLQLRVDVIKNDIPFLIGLDVLDKNSLQVLTAENQLHSVKENWKTPTRRHNGHVYYTWKLEYSNLFSRTQLERLHRHLMHPSATKLFDLLSRANADNITSSTMKTLQEICRSCETCQVYRRKEMVFRIRQNGKTRFNQRVLIDIFYLDTGNGKKTPALHVVDAGTSFQNAIFLRNVDTTTVWNAFLKSWATLYVGFPESMLTDQGSVFLSKEWEFNCGMAEIELSHTGTESHNSLGSGETFHEILRRIYMKTRAEHKQMAPDIFLSLAVKVINSTVGPKGLCPQLLVFGILPRLPEISKRDFPAQRERFNALITARKEYEKIVADRCVKKGIRSIPPPAADHLYVPGDYVYVYREGLKNYTGPHMIAEIQGKHVRIHLGERTGPRSFNVSQIRPSSLGDSESKHNYWEAITSGTPKLFWTEVLPIGDSREALFDDAKRQEILGLIERGTFRIVLEEEVSANPNIVPSRFVLAIKHAEDGTEKLKARFVVGGHLDKSKKDVVHNSVTLRHSSLRMIMALATILGFEIWTMDVKQAYLQSASTLLRDVFVRQNQIELQPGELLKLVKPLYGLSDSGDYWCETFARFHTHNQYGEGLVIVSFSDLRIFGSFSEGPFAFGETENSFCSREFSIKCVPSLFGGEAGLHWLGQTVSCPFG